MLIKHGVLGVMRGKENPDNLWGGNHTIMLPQGSVHGNLNRCMCVHLPHNTRKRCVCVYIYLGLLSAKFLVLTHHSCPL